MCCTRLLRPLQGSKRCSFFLGLTWFELVLAAGTQCGLSFSLLYAPPEVIQSVESQAKGMRADPKTDMWAMGVIAYELLTRTRIFPASLTRAEVSFIRS